MDDLEQQLQRAFARQDAPEGFAERVIGLVAHGLIRAASRLISTPELTVSHVRRDKSVRYKVLAAAAAVLVLAVSGYGYRQYRGEMAKREVLLAFRIASVKLNHIQTQVSR